MTVQKRMQAEFARASERMQKLPVASRPVVTRPAAASSRNDPRPTKSK